MAVMPHTDPTRALAVALSTDIPFWPQLPRLSYYEDIWSILAGKGIDKDYLLSRSLISPATCCLVNPDGEKTVEEAFRVVQNLSGRLREKYNLA